MESSECTLASASCTTGWTDWIHGELWVCRDGIFRRSLGLWATMAHGSGPTVDPVGRITRRVTPSEIAQATARRRNLWVPWDSIASPELRHGFMTDSLHLRLKDGRRRKFLWLAVDQAHAPLAAALEQSIGDRFVRAAAGNHGGADSLQSAGAEPAVSDVWPVTLVANWVDPGIDLLELRSAIVLLAAGVWATGARLIVDGRFDVRMLGLAVFAGAWVAWRAVRYRPVALELILSPDSARVRETRGADVRTHELARQRAGWLSASESGLDWRDRRLALFDDAERAIAQFKARRATVTARADSADGDAWLQGHLPGTGGRAKTEASVTALLGTWWPHPERRLSIRGNAAVRRRWEEPSLPEHVAWDRRQRRLYAAVFGAFMLFFVLIGVLLPGSAGERLAYLPLVVGGLALAVRHLLW